MPMGDCARETSLSEPSWIVSFLTLSVYVHLEIICTPHRLQAGAKISQSPFNLITSLHSNRRSLDLFLRSPACRQSLNSSIAAMAPRAPRQQVDIDHPLKPKTEKAKVVKAKAEKLDKSKNDKKDQEKGGKVKPVNGDEALQLIADYLKAQNRPYSATEVSANLHGNVSVHKTL